MTSIGGRIQRAIWLAVSFSFLGLWLGIDAARGDLLTVAATDVVFPDVTLDGTDQATTSVAVAVWTIVDARLTGAAWSVTVSASTPTSAAGSVETIPRTVAVSNLKVTTGSITAGIGSDPAVNITGATNLVLSTSPQTLVSATGASIGTYTFLPTMSFTMPANAYRSNYSGTVGSSTLLPYTSSLTVTIA